MKSLDTFICRKCYGHSLLADIVIHCYLYCFPYSYLIFRSCELVIADYIGQSTKIPEGYCDDCRFHVWLEAKSLPVVLHNKLDFSEIKQCKYVAVQGRSLRISFTWHLYLCSRFTSQCQQSGTSSGGAGWLDSNVHKWGIVILIAYCKAHLRHAFFNTVGSLPWGCPNLHCPQSALPTRLNASVRNWVLHWLSDWLGFYFHF